METLIFVLVCFFSCHQAIPLTGSVPVVINSKLVDIPDATTEGIKSTPISVKIHIGPPLTPSTSTTDHTTSTPPVNPTKPSTPHTPSTSTVTTPTSTSTKAPTTSTQPPTTSSHPPTTTTVPPSTSTTVSPSTSTTVFPPTSSTSGPTAHPTSQPVVPTAAPAPTNRGFDGPSFIGGIVLAAGLMAIGFVAFKFYKARTELNYHTL